MQMMPQVHDVVVREEPERLGWIGADQTLHIPEALWNVFNHVGEVVVVGMPQRSQRIPRAVLVALTPDPVLLCIRWKHQRLALLRADEALVVV